MKTLFFGLTILASTIRAVPIDLDHSVGFEQTESASTVLIRRQDDYDIVRNELTDVAGVDCKPITVIFARGTFELGNVGAFVGPPFFNNLDDLIGANNIAVQGVDYPASLVGYLEGGDPGGAKTTANLLNQAASDCPNTQIVLSGYSQGAQEAHLGEAMVSAAVAARIAAVVVFGDPFKGRPFPNIDPSRVMTYCFNLDLICDGIPIADPEHLDYAVDTPAAAAFVQSHVTY